MGGDRYPKAKRTAEIIGSSFGAHIFLSKIGRAVGGFFEKIKGGAAGGPGRDGFLERTSF